MISLKGDTARIPNLSHEVSMILYYHRLYMALAHYLTHLNPTQFVDLLDLLSILDHKPKVQQQQRTSTTTNLDTTRSTKSKITEQIDSSL